MVLELAVIHGSRLLQRALVPGCAVQVQQPQGPRVIDLPGDTR